MDLLKNQTAVARISTAVFVPCGKGGLVHKNRATHGIAYNFGCDTTYRFETGEILTCHSGEAIYLPMSSNYTVDKGEIPLETGAGTYAINFLTLPAALALPPQKTAVRGKEEMLALFKKAVLSWRRKDAGYFEECFADLYRIIKLLKKEETEYTAFGRTAARLAPAMKYINENYTAETISIGKLAELCGVSQPYFRRMFAKATSLSPAVYIRNLRIGYAKELLQTGDYSVTDAAMLAGFSDASYFSREFKKAVGISPKENRKEEPQG